MAARSMIPRRETTPRRCRPGPPRLRRNPFEGRRSIADFLNQLPPGRTARADENRFDLALMANAFGEGPGPLSRDVHKPGVPRDLIENGQDPLWFRHKAAVEVGFELQQGVIDSQAVRFHGPRD